MWQNLTFDEIFCNFLDFGDREKCLSNLEMGDQSDINQFIRCDRIWRFDEIFCNFLDFDDREKCLSNLEMGDQSDINDFIRFDVIWRFDEITNLSWNFIKSTYHRFTTKVDRITD